MNHLENVPWEVRQMWDGFSVVDSEGWEIGKWTSLEFARLIAAAPDLRAALEVALPILEERAITLRRLAVRDTKAQPGIERMAEEVESVIEQARAALAGSGEAGE